MELVNSSVIMTSLELVGYINSIRKEGEAELTHADFLKKVPKVLNGGQGKFSSSYLNSQNKKQPCYNFPKREACLMAMSYSYELQALVFDKMTALENELKSKQTAIQDKRSTHSPMMAALIEQRADDGKDTKFFHFTNENLLCNWAVTGKRESLDESQLTLNDMQLLTYARRTNESLIIADIPFDERKRLLAIKVDKKRNKLVKLLAKN